MKVFVVGTRGVPDIPGGVERHCEQLYPRLVKYGVTTKLSRRSSYVGEQIVEWAGIQLIDVFSPEKKSFEAIVHTFISLIAAAKWRADLVHVHAIGPALLVPFAKILGMKVIVTNHGPDYDRQKWGWAAKSMLKLGEFLGCKYADEVIVISEPIREIVQKRCGRAGHLIYNGVPLPELSEKSDYIEGLGVEAGQYILTVARLVPEKGLHDLIEAYSRLDTNVKLVIAGDADHEDAYIRALRKNAEQYPNIIMPGYITGTNLEQIYSHARLFVLPSYHEGLPIALLEALSYGLPVVLSDIPANIEVGLDPDYYFNVGDVHQLKLKLEQLLAQNQASSERETRRKWVSKKYNWDEICEQTFAVYRQSLGDDLS